MIGFDLLCKGLIPGAGFRPVMEAVYLITTVLLDLLLMTLRTGPFRFPVTAVVLFSETPLSFRSAPAIEGTRLAFHAVMDFWHISAMIVAFDMLPGFAPFAEDRITIVILESADALDGIRLFFVRGDRVRNSAVYDGRVQRGGDRRGLRGWMRDGDWGGICHNPTEYPLLS